MKLAAIRCRFSFRLIYKPKLRTRKQQSLEGLGKTVAVNSFHTEEIERALVSFLIHYHATFPSSGYNSETPPLDWLQHDYSPTSNDQNIPEQ